MLEQGVWLPPSQFEAAFVSTAHTKQDVEATLVAARAGIPVYHMEAGNRCYDDNVPEEVNRRVIDHVSHMLLPYTHRSMENLVHEGIDRRRIVVTGNPIFEVLQKNTAGIQASCIMERLDLVPKEFFVVTVHRSENVDNPVHLGEIFEGLTQMLDLFQMPMVVSLHPRTRDRLDRARMNLHHPLLKVLEPLGFYDFIRLEQEAGLVLTDSGTVQEECAIFGVPSVTLRHVTERPETIECGSNVLAGTKPQRILEAATLAMTQSEFRWQPPPEYLVPHVSQIVSRVLLGESLWH
jgi:UDP-N-acetylglucosamine 2-epimerase (non-hydrolysing)